MVPRSAALQLAVTSALAIGPQLGLERHAADPRFTIALTTFGAALLWGLLTFPRWNDELSRLKAFGKAFAFMLFVLYIENFLTWATSALDMRKYDYQPLQDNVAIALDWAMAKWPLVRTLLLGWRVDMHWLLIAFLGLCLSVIWRAVPYSGFAIGARFISTVAWTHLIRTFGFVITVLPNPKHHCYHRSFASPPEDPWEWIKYGLSSKRGSGCNDLVISGHGVVYACVPLALHTFGGGWRASAVAWLALLKLCLQESVERTHYSVDMFLAVAVTALTWHWCAPECDAGKPLPPRLPGQKKDPLPIAALAFVFAVIAIIFIGVHGV